MNTNDRPEYSTNELLKLALTMLDVARENQVERKRNQNWLVKNTTLEVIRARVAANKGKVK